jgi:hypothetical protein
MYEGTHGGRSSRGAGIVWTPLATVKEGGKCLTLDGEAAFI